MPQTDITLRDIPGKRDREDVRSILESTGFFYPREVEVALELLEDWLLKLEKSEFLFLFAGPGGGPAIGYICYAPVVLTTGRFEIYWIAVRKDAQRKGIGSILISETERRMRELGGRYVYVDTASRPAYGPTRAFYARQGYREVARVPKYFAEDDDKIIFMKRLG